LENKSGKKNLDFLKDDGRIYTVNTVSQKETTDIAAILGKLLKADDVVCLDGDLGAGKTVFAAGIAKSLGIEGPVPSPTFTVLIEHRSGELPFFHFDVYRLNSVDEFFDLGFTEYFYEGGVCVIEWASKIQGAIDKTAIEIIMQRDVINFGDFREITFCFPQNDERFDIIIEEVKKYYDNFS